MALRGLRTRFAGGIKRFQGHALLLALKGSKDTFCWWHLEDTLWHPRVQGCGCSCGGTVWPSHNSCAELSLWHRAGRCPSPNDPTSLLTFLGHPAMVTATVRVNVPSLLPLLCPALPTEWKCGCCSLQGWADPCSPLAPSGSAGILKPCCRNIKNPARGVDSSLVCLISHLCNEMLIYACRQSSQFNWAGLGLCWIISFTAYKWNRIKSETFAIFLAAFFGQEPWAAAPCNAIYLDLFPKIQTSLQVKPC